MNDERPHIRHDDTRQEPDEAATRFGDDGSGQPHSGERADIPVTGADQHQHEGEVERGPRRWSAKTSAIVAAVAIGATSAGAVGAAAAMPAGSGSGGMGGPGGGMQHRTGQGQTNGGFGAGVQAPGEGASGGPGQQGSGAQGAQGAQGGQQGQMPGGAPGGSGAAPGGADSGAGGQNAPQG